MSHPYRQFVDTIISKVSMIPVLRFIYNNLRFFFLAVGLIVSSFMTLRLLLHTHNHFMTLQTLSRITRVSQYQKKRSHSHLSWSSVILYLLPPSIMIRGILPVQFTCLVVFSHNLCPSFLWSASLPGTLSFILHTFLHPVFFLQRMPIPSQPVLL